ncbi:MAG: SUF system NifU family Fe-S cluster assembly protein [Candidatus Hydrogenedentes bacterium]|nr:SUF system NifU family Fe-S cluster assembly protein [Candidatus Hydrogenedentota bacterium]
MEGKRTLYEQVILDHNRKPRNYGEMPDSDLQAEGYNPLCGDQFTVYVKMNGDTIADLRFEGAGCAISKSSASVMTTLLKGKTREEAAVLVDRFKAMITSAPDVELDAEKLGKLMVFSGVREYPVRIKCATLAWHTLISALRGETEPASTE